MSDSPAPQPEALQGMDPQAAAELAQELTLVARAMFAQLLPDTAANAVAGISSPVASTQEPPVDAGVPAPVGMPAAPKVTSVPVPVVSVPLPSVPVPLAVPVSPAARLPIQPGAAAEPGPTAPATIAMPADAVIDADEPAPAGTTPKPAPRTMAMLEEITFLDE